MTTAWKMPHTDAITAATPLTLYKSAGTITPMMDLFLGRCAGSIGETFRLGIILGGLFLMFSKVSNWRVPVFYLGTVLVLSFIGNKAIGARVAPPMFQFLAGGLLGHRVEHRGRIRDWPSGDRARRFCCRHSVCARLQLRPASGARPI